MLQGIYINQEVIQLFPIENNRARNLSLCQRQFINCNSHQNRMNLNQLTVPSLDLSKSILFYENLGLKLIVKSLPDYARFECPTGTSTFSIHKTERLPRGKGITIYFECEDLDQQVEIIKKKE